MTIEEAIKLLEIQKPVLGCKEYKKPLMCAYEMAIAALEKQIPKKPYIQQIEVDYYEHDCYECPNQNNYCPECGQAIDWSGENVN